LNRGPVQFGRRSVGGKDTARAGNWAKIDETLDTSLNASSQAENGWPWKAIEFPLTAAFRRRTRLQRPTPGKTESRPNHRPSKADARSVTSGAWPTRQLPSLFCSPFQRTKFGQIGGRGARHTSSTSLASSARCLSIMSAVCRRAPDGLVARLSAENLNRRAGSTTFGANRFCCARQMAGYHRLRDRSRTRLIGPGRVGRCRRSMRRRSGGQEVGARKSEAR